MKRFSFFLPVVLFSSVVLAILLGPVQARFPWTRPASSPEESPASSHPFSSPQVTLQGRDWTNLLPPSPVRSPRQSLPPRDELRYLPASGRVPRPQKVKGIYVTSWVAGSSYFTELVRLVDETELNTMVIDIKDDTGVITYPSRVRLAEQIGATSRRADISHVLELLREHHIYPIARIAVFKDNLLPRRRPDLAIHRREGEVWQDKQGITWADPYNREVWDYNLALAKEAIRLGFSEVQFDYVRFPDVPKGTPLVYPCADQRTKAEVIRDFLTYARRQLHPLGVPVSADIFGLVTTAQDDLGIGQHLETLARTVDYLHPMVYPSHYYHGEYGLADPDAVPYTTVKYSLQDATRRLATVPSSAKVIPWLQDFTLRHHYGPAEVRAQIKAAQEVGIEEFFLWNPRNRYTREALLDGEAPLSPP